jgi:tRNA (cytidine/uridine-2'-O-)-methyltransferase
MFHIVLIQPEIPPNTGNIIRLAANTGAMLHLVKPLGFELTARAVRRAGLDYEELAPVRVHASIEACSSASRQAARFPTARRALNAAMHCSSEPRRAVFPPLRSPWCRPIGSS